MQPTLIRRSGGYDPKNGHYLGTFGEFGAGNHQKGIITYSLSSNRQRPLAGTLNAAVFNSWRRFRGQALYWIPPMVGAYYLMAWATEKNEFYNSKEGRALFGDEE